MKIKLKIANKNPGQLTVVMKTEKSTIEPQCGSVKLRLV